MLCTGLMGRIFQHELDHLNGELMWEDVKVKNVPRRLERQIKISEVERSPEDFYNEN